MRRATVGVLLAALLGAGTVAGQSRPDLRLEWEDGRTQRAPLVTDHGYAALPADLFRTLGWAVATEGPDHVFRGPGGVELRLRPGSPFLRWDDEVLQMVEAAYEDDGAFHVPAQLVTDFLPRRLPDLYVFDGPRLALHTATGGEAPEPELELPSEYEGVRVVVIDAGHGGRDPGSISASGIREKTVALAVARAVARRLAEEPDLEVHLLREDDTFIPVWDRGPLATERKGERPGVLLSIHANSFSSSARGFETYFLSDARTEHERRVAAIENAPLPGEEGEAPRGDDLGFILRELRNLDHQHWSALLAEMIQEDVDDVHPGPNRGVKQAPLAVMTNALMPAVLIELGYLSHPEEARLLARADFQRSAGEAIARSVLRFFERYPPGSWSRTGGP